MSPPKNEWNEETTGADAPPDVHEDDVADSLGDDDEFPSSQTVVSSPDFQMPQGRRSTPVIPLNQPAAKAPVAKVAVRRDATPVDAAPGQPARKRTTGPTSATNNLSKLQSLQLGAVRAGDPILPKPPSPSRSFPIGKIVVAVGLIGALGYGATHWAEIKAKLASSQTPTGTEKPAMRFVIAEMSTRTATTLSSAGFLVADSFTIGATVSGRIKSVAVGPGDAVKKDQLLIQLDDSEIRAQLALAYQKVANLKRLLGQQLKLRAAEAITQMEVEKTRNDIALASAEASVLIPKLKQMKIISPSAATVIDVLARPGETLSTSAGATVGVVKLADLSHLLVETNIAENDIANIHIGDHAVVSVESVGDQTFPALVKLISTEADRARGTVKVTLSVTSDPRLRPNMSAKIKFQGSATPTPRMLLPKDALLSGSAMWVVVDGRATRRTVTTQAAGADVDVLTGLKVGERVIVSGFQGLAEGDKVAVTP